MAAGRPRPAADSRNARKSTRARAGALRAAILAAVFASLTAVLSWINVPLFFTPVPINLALIGPYLAGLLLGFRYGLLSQVIYVLLGVLGLPVFAGFSGGLGALAGPTGGYIIGYAVCAAICGLGRALPGCQMSRPVKIPATAALLTLGLCACYLFGLVWYAAVLGVSLWSGFIACILPFLPGDAAKIAVAALLYRYLAPAISVSLR